MEPSKSLDDILQHMDPSLLQGYKKFMHEVIIQGISYDNCTLDTLNSCLLDLHKKVMNDIVEKFLTTRCMHQKKLSPLEFEHVRAMTSMVFYKTHAGSTQLHIVRWLSLSSLVSPMVWI